jgi:hypothetical protein
MMSWKGHASRCGLFSGTVPAFSWKNRMKARKPQDSGSLDQDSNLRSSKYEAVLPPNCDT